MPLAASVHSGSIPGFQRLRHVRCRRPTDGSCLATARAHRQLRRGPALLARARRHQLRRPGRADRDHAHRAGRAPPLDQRTALPARAELLHAAARAAGAAARDLPRRADAPHLGRHRRRRAGRARGAPHRLAGAEEPLAVGDRRGGVRRDLRARPAVPGDRARRGPDRPPRRGLGAARLRPRRRSWWRAAGQPRAGTDRPRPSPA